MVRLRSLQAFLIYLIRILRRGWRQAAWLAILLLGAACRTAVAPTPAAYQVSLTVDGQQTTHTTTAVTVRDFLETAGVVLAPADEVSPPLFTPLVDGLTITVVRVTERLEVSEQPIPFGRRLLRNAELDAAAPPQIIQPGRDGLQAITVRAVYRDGREAERWPTQTRVLTPAQDEIVMVGIGAAQTNVAFPGVIAYIDDGRAVLLRGATALPEQLATGAGLDGRVFRLSPSGGHLLYSRAAGDGNGARFGNSLWVIRTTRDARPQPLGVENVLWADWDPSRSARPRIAYTTAAPTDLPPGWEANNDLWLGSLPTSATAAFAPERIVASYPAAYGWWGGNYAWSPDGRFLAYSFADEIGLIDAQPRDSDGDDDGDNGAAPRRVLQRFTEYNTLADWVWVPTLSWSPDGRFLAFTLHAGDDPNAPLFDGWLLDAQSGLAVRTRAQVGAWAHWRWAPAAPDAPADSRIAFLQAIDPLDSLRSPYALWLMDQDGSNARRVYPPPGENSFFPREPQSLAWSPDGQSLAFIFNNQVVLFDLAGGGAQIVSQGDGRRSHLTWAPYGTAVAPAP